jgi:glycosyltransferase involved in cell wall biosynthesis
MTTISLTIIVRDSEKTIFNCLNTFYPCADEIVIVDTGSTDQTIQIAKKFTDKIYYFDWINDFSAARNYSFEKCTGDFIVWVDSDDFIEESDARKIRTLNFENNDIFLCQHMLCLDEFQQPAGIIVRERIIRRSLGLRWREPVHEYLPIVEHKTCITDIKTWHIQQHNSSERNLKIIERAITADPSNSRNIYYYGVELTEANHIDAGIVQLEHFIKIGGFWEDIFNAHYRLAKIFMSIDEKKFKFHLFESLKMEERRAEPYYLMAQYWESRSNWFRAIQWYEFCTIVKRPKELLTLWQPDYYTWLPCLALCVCYNNVGNIERAYEWNDRALAYRPNDPRMINNQRLLLNAINDKKKQQKENGSAYEDELTRLRNAMDKIGNPNQAV